MDLKLVSEEFKNVGLLAKQIDRYISEEDEEVSKFKGLFFLFMYCEDHIQPHI